ncbi:bifunctional folylpolyglutamate synthase/dihydrofolate synthase [Brevibacillus massiliensis]|jgi:dihydrofolate synthase/folylpolyglutamate synthase|uniref:bifunctional folylpolyglutamate synthase/dihydrofolate synthase n=1 Tax=Brevibacillus massiliensis TaxID=1118054 RepID=UPI00030C290A|nr:folylpolyglutamate synthase/dihydrofolate synthase family protein [Brevibacillus massiliensis]
MGHQLFSSYDEALEWIHSLLRFGQKPGLERMEWMLEQLSHPERRLAFVHVAGTNGKGSTCAMLSQVLREANYTVGMFTSPYVLDFRERIRYNNEMISEQDLLALANQIKPLVDRCCVETEYGSPTEFEVITVMALLYFANMTRPAVVIWETGLGGRMDSTNVVHPLVSVITNVGTDHADVLGPTISDIAREKGGIIKPGVPVVVGEAGTVALAEIERIAQEKRATLYQLGRDFHVQVERIEGLEEQSFRYCSFHRRGESEYVLHLPGLHQLKNAAVALMVLDLLRQFFAYLIEEEEISSGLQQTRWPGRLEVVAKHPLILLDGAHNKEGMTALVRSVSALLPEEARLHLLVAALADKPLADMAAAWKQLDSRLERVYVTSFEFHRAAPPKMLTDAFITAGIAADRVTEVLDWRPLLRNWQHETEHPDDVFIVCGSLYFIAQVRSFFPIPIEEAGE